MTNAKKKSTTAAKKPAAKAQNDAPIDAPAPTVRDAPDVPMIPPIILLLFIMAGIVLSWVLPVNFGHGWGTIGFIMFFTGIGTVIWCKKLFDNAGTNISPDEPTLVIIQDGPYKFSRNPIYVSFLAVYAGLAMMANAPVMLLLTIPLWYVLKTKVVEREEGYLEEKFGAEYLEYKHSKRRWL